MERRNFAAAEQAAKKLLEMSGPEREEAKQVAEARLDPPGTVGTKIAWINVVICSH